MATDTFYKGYDPEQYGRSYGLYAASQPYIKKISAPGTAQGGVITCLLYTSRDEALKEDYDHAAYRKAILDATSLVDHIKEDDVDAVSYTHLS